MARSMVCYIHGGTTFPDRSSYLDFLRHRTVDINPPVHWAETLRLTLDDDYHIIAPRMPLRENAHYEEWKIHFERYMAFFIDPVVFIGYSLGGIFLAKYFAQHPTTLVKSLILIAAPFDDSLPGEPLTGGFDLPSDLSLLNKHRMYLLYSQDDQVVPVSHMHKYLAHLSDAHHVVFQDKNGHFRVEEFPELLTLISDCCD